MKRFFPPLKQSRSSMQRRAGFTLAEVTLAIGVISFGLIGIMGLMPVGLTTLRTAMDQTVQAQIVQKLSGKILLTPFNNLENKFSNQSFFYDQEGLELSGSAKALFSAQTTLTQAVYPGAAASGTGSLRQVQIDVTRLPGDGKARRFNIYVPNSGN